MSIKKRKRFVMLTPVSVCDGNSTTTICKRMRAL